MSWKLIGRPKTLRVTRKLADQFAEMDPAPRDRPLSERRLQVYTRLLNEGQFRPVTWATTTCKETGGTYRVNGKHTSTMLSGLEEMPEFYVVVEEYECDTLEDVAKLYATFDSKMQSRTSRDINMSFAGTIAELSNIGPTIINLSVTGMAYHLWGSRAAERQPADRAELLMEYSEFVLWMQDMGMSNRGRAISKCSHISRGPVVSAMFATWLKDKMAATEFWLAVRDETGDNPNLPDRKLAKYLSTFAVGRSGGTNRSRRVEPREMYVKCLHGWNAWRKGENTTLNYYEDAKVPIAQ